MARNHPRGSMFNDYRVITARYESKCKCGESTKAGDLIAYAKGAPVKCMNCYNAWADEVKQEGDLCDRNMERMGY